MTRTWLVNSRWCNIYHSSNSTTIWPHWCRSTGEGFIWSTAACNRLCHTSLLARVLKDFRVFFTTLFLFFGHLSSLCPCVLFALLASFCTSFLKVSISLCFLHSEVFWGPVQATKGWFNSLRLSFSDFAASRIMTLPSGWMCPLPVHFSYCKFCSGLCQALKLGVGRKKGDRVCIPVRCFSLRISGGRWQ